MYPFYENSFLGFNFRGNNKIKSALKADAFFKKKKKIRLVLKICILTFLHTPTKVDHFAPHKGNIFSTLKITKCAHFKQTF